MANAKGRLSPLPAGVRSPSRSDGQILYAEASFHGFTRSDLRRPRHVSREWRLRGRGSRDAQKKPAAMRAMGAHVSDDGRSVTVFLPEPNAARTLANLRDNGRIAVTFSRPSDYRSIQVKGSCVDFRPATEEERARQKTYAAAFVDDLATVGMARENTGRLTYWPSIAVRISVPPSDAPRCARCRSSPIA
jgi:hypothetical protein